MPCQTAQKRIHPRTNGGTSTKPSSVLIQFAIGWNVPLEARAIVRLTAKFRRAVLKEMLCMLTGDGRMTWTEHPLKPVKR